MPLVPLYRDRTDAGRILAGLLTAHAGRDDPLILALPRGGVPVAIEIARRLRAPLDVFLVRKLGLPGQPELAMGAIASGGVCLLDDTRIAAERVSAADLAAVVARETAELHRRESLYRGARPPPRLAGRRIVLVDDGLATGYSMRAAVAAVRRSRPATIVVAVPVGPPDTCDALAREVDQLVCPLQPSPFDAVGLWYGRFPAVSDAEVRAGLARA